MSDRLEFSESEWRRFGVSLIEVWKEVSRPGLRPRFSSDPVDVPAWRALLEVARDNGCEGLAVELLRYDSSVLSECVSWCRRRFGFVCEQVGRKNLKHV